VDDVDYFARAVYLSAADAFVVADLHVGRSEASDVEYPLGERRDLLERLRRLLGTVDPKTVVFAGDVLHRFGTVTERSRVTVERLATCCRDAGSDPVFVRGNHDAALDSIRNDVRDAYVASDDPRIVVCHGHEEPSVDADAYVIGHDHPAIEIEGQRRPCFLNAPDAHRGGDVLMLPAFSRAAAGVDINDARGEDLLSPLVGDLDSVRPVVYDEEAAEALAFPPLESFRRML